MKKIVNPIRVAEKENRQKLISFSRINKRVIVSDDTWKFIYYLSTLKSFDDEDIEYYVRSINSINEIDSYKELLKRIEEIGAIEKL